MKYLFITVLLVSGVSSAGVIELIFKDNFETQQSCTQDVVFEESFNIPDQNTWPNLWQESGSEVDLVETVNAQGRLIPVASSYSLARMYHPLNEQDVEVTFSFAFENGATQGVGFYVRSNGGYLDLTNPTGQGYAVFLERFNANQPGLGLWYENDGNEIPFIRDYNASYGLVDDVIYQVRFQVFQETPTTTRLRARVWQDGQLEPGTWQVSLADNFVPLQNTLGGIAIDSWSTQTSGTITDAIKINDIAVTRLCN